MFAVVDARPCFVWGIPHCCASLRTLKFTGDVRGVSTSDINQFFTLLSQTPLTELSLYLLTAEPDTAFLHGLALLTRMEKLELASGDHGFDWSDIKSNHFPRLQSLTLCDDFRLSRHSLATDRCRRAERSTLQL